MQPRVPLNSGTKKKIKFLEAEIEALHNTISLYHKIFDLKINKDSSPQTPELIDSNDEAHTFIETGVAICNPDTKMEKELARDDPTTKLPKRDSIVLNSPCDPVLSSPSPGLTLNQEKEDLSRSDIIMALKNHFSAKADVLHCSAILNSISESTTYFPISLIQIGQAIRQHCGSLSPENFQSIRKHVILYYAKKSPDKLSYYVYQNCEQILQTLPNCSEIYKLYYKPPPTL